MTGHFLAAAEGEGTFGDILAVDDLPNNLDLLRSILSRAGYRVRTANNGPLALRIVERKVPDLVLLDINMPEMDGFEVCRRLKEMPDGASLPVIFISALDGVLDKVRGFKAGGVDYVVKPFQAEEVLMRVQTHLEIHRLRKQLEERNRELERKQKEILKSQRKVEMVFTALADVLPGTVLDGKYSIGRKIGAGGYGAVYEGEHVHLGRRVAIKILQPVSRSITPNAFERFRLEGISACRIRHHNAVEVLDSGVSDRGIAYLIMELLEGFTVRQLLDGSPTVPLHRAASIVAPVASVLAQASSMGLVHRDIKPENIFLHRQPGSAQEVVKLVDFGIAKMLDEGQAQGAEGEADKTGGSAIKTTGLIGTPFYIAPERLLDGQDSIKSDLYSLGVTFYEMVSGRRPFEDLKDGLRILVKICQSEPQELLQVAPHLPPWVSHFTMRMLDKEPENRPTVREVQAFFENLSSAGGASGELEGATVPAPQLGLTTVPLEVYPGVAVSPGVGAEGSMETVTDLHSYDSRDSRDSRDSKTLPFENKSAVDKPTL